LAEWDRRLEWTLEDSESVLPSVEAVLAKREVVGRAMQVAAGQGPLWEQAWWMANSRRQVLRGYNRRGATSPDPGVDSST